MDCVVKLNAEWDLRCVLLSLRQNNTFWQNAKLDISSLITNHSHQNVHISMNQIKYHKKNEWKDRSKNIYWSRIIHQPTGWNDIHVSLTQNQIRRESNHFEPISSNWFQQMLVIYLVFVIEIYLLQDPSNSIQFHHVAQFWCVNHTIPRKWKLDEMN